MEVSLGSDSTILNAPGALLGCEYRERVGRSPSAYKVNPNISLHLKPWDNLIVVWMTIG